MDKQNVFLLTDQPTTCPICGARTHFEEVKEEQESYQLHTCPSADCAYTFIAEEE